jgi:hypothetical protein
VKKIEGSSLYKKIKERIGSFVEVRTIDDRVIFGKLVSFNPEDGSIMLENAHEKNKKIPSVYISGSAVAQINFFDKGDEEEQLDKKVEALLRIDPTLTYEEIARILDIPIQLAEKIVKKSLRSS